MRRFLVVVAALTTVVWLAFAPAGASAHSLDSSTISVHVTDQTVTATISVALETLDQALGTDHAIESDVTTYASDVIAYLDEHLTVTGADSTVWGETYSNPAHESVEGIESFSVDVTFDTNGVDTESFTIDYDGIIEAVTDHTAVVVLTDADGDVSTPGIIDSSGNTVTIGDGSDSVAVGDMVHYGFEHVLDGADHLLFLATLLLPSPLVVAGRRWRRGGSTAAAVRKVVHVVTAFTIGHSITLIASASGWISLPSRPIEVVIACSVAVAAIHAIRPMASRGEPIIAVAFGLVHGLAFAGILRDLGLDGSTSVLALLSFNIGIELAQLLTTALVFPSLLLLSRTKAANAVRITGATIALIAALGWILDRLGIVANPVAPIENEAIAHPWHIVGGLAIVAIAVWTREFQPFRSGGSEQAVQGRPEPCSEHRVRRAASRKTSEVQSASRLVV